MSTTFIDKSASAVNTSRQTAEIIPLKAMSDAAPPPTRNTPRPKPLARHNGGPPILDEEMPRPGDWVALSRRVREHPIVGCGQPVRPADEARGAWSRFEAWFDLLCLAQYKPARYNNRGEVITLEVGQLVGALTFLADRWNWTVKTVRSWLDVLEREGMVSWQSKGMTSSDGPRNRARVLSIENYSRYQMLSEAIDRYLEGSQGHAKGMSKGMTSASEGHDKGMNRVADSPTKSATSARRPRVKGMTGAPQGTATGHEQGQESNNSSYLGETSHPLATVELEHRKGDALAAHPPVTTTSSKGSRFSETWQLRDNPEWGTWALERYTNVTREMVAAELYSFRDHWSAATGAKATKRNWAGAWRQWCRKREQGWGGKPWVVRPEVARAEAASLPFQGHATPAPRETAVARELREAREHDERLAQADRDRENAR